jgi:thymidylate synthase (FAD)
METSSVVCPPSVQAHEEAREIFERAQKEAHEAYRTLCSLGIPREDARYLLPHGFETSLVLTMNAREMMHFFSLRLCRRAQWEIQHLAKEMLRQARGVAPYIFAVAGPSCISKGSCEEERPCGNPYQSMEELLEE